MITRQSLTTLVLGALAGSGLGAGALALLHPRCGESCAAGAGGVDDESPSAARRTFADGGSGAALASLARSGPADGRLTYRDPKRLLEQTVLRDPTDASVVHLRKANGGPGVAQAVPVELLARVFFGDVARFLQNYRPCEAPTPDTLDGRPLLRVHWCNVRGGAGPSRDVWIDPSTQFLARFEDRSSEGHLIRSLVFSAGLTPAAANEFVPPVPQPPSASRPKFVTPALSSRTIPSFEDFAGRVEIPVYEPAELPPGFRRTEYGYDRRALGERSPALRVVWIGYDEGVMQMNLFIAPPEDMGRLESYARQAAVAKGSSAGSAADAVSQGTCASMPVDTPEELFSEGAVTIRVRSDGCRIVLRRDDLTGVSVALVGSTALPREAYIRTIRNLVPVRSAAPVAPPVTDEPRAPGTGDAK